MNKCYREAQFGGVDVTILKYRYPNIHNAWGNSASSVDAEKITEVRSANYPTQNDDILVLRMK